MPFTLLSEPDRRTVFLLNYFRDLADRRARERAIEKAKGKTALDPASAITGSFEGAKAGYSASGHWLGAVIGGVAGAGLGGLAGKEAKGREAMEAMRERTAEEASWKRRQQIQQQDTLARMREQQQARLREAAYDEGYPSVEDYIAGKQQERTKYQLQSIHNILDNLDQKRLGPRQQAIADGIMNDLFEVLDDDETLTDDQRGKMIDRIHKRVNRFWGILPNRKPPWPEGQGIGQVWWDESGARMTRDNKGNQKVLVDAPGQDFDTLLKTYGVDELGEPLPPQEAASAIIKAQKREAETRAAYQGQRAQQKQRQEQMAERAARIAALPPEETPPRVPVGVPRARPARPQVPSGPLGPAPPAATQKAAAQAVSSAHAAQPMPQGAPTADPIVMAQRVVATYKMNPKSVDREDARKAAKILLDRLVSILESRESSPTAEEKTQLRELREIAR